MSDLAPSHALGGAQPRTVAHGSLRLTETPSTALASLSARRGCGAPPFALPAPGTWIAAGALNVIWTGPGQYMVEGPGLAHTDFAARIAALAAGWSVTEQTDAWVVIAVDGPPEPLLARLVNVDPARMGPGQACRTVIEHMPVFLVRRAVDRLDILGMRSAAGSLWHRLEATAGRLGMDGIDSA